VRDAEHGPRARTLRQVVEALLDRIARDAKCPGAPDWLRHAPREGKELAELAELAANGVVALSDDGSPVANARFMRNAMELAAAMGIPISEHCDDPCSTATAR
jgi:dihydroorotase